MINLITSVNSDNKIVSLGGNVNYLPFVFRLYGRLETRDSIPNIAGSFIVLSQHFLGCVRFSSFRGPRHHHWSFFHHYYVVIYLITSCFINTYKNIIHLPFFFIIFYFYYYIINCI